MTVVSETSDAARVETLWFTYGHDPDSGYYDVFERTAFVLVKRTKGGACTPRKNSATSDS
ncbi:hypothetical protein [Streptomyces fuscichromogenes]|uniref:hypothetical protein n=1 Tax=Streptomyces fuscichromogenes TaxID=1324013 RepID=UPI001670ECDE|nr:hypothetical protein [Streptomyces fuscichromogenes]